MMQNAVIVRTPGTTVERKQAATGLLSDQA
jgi:hypothetical protein